MAVLLASLSGYLGFNLTLKQKSNDASDSKVNVVLQKATLLVGRSPS